MDKLFKSVDKTVFLLATTFTFAFIIWIAFFTESAEVMLGVILGVVMENFGWTYLLTSLLLFTFCIFLCFSKFGKIKLGKEDDKPEFGRISWLAMMFSAAMGVGLIFYGAAEPMTLFANPPAGKAFTESGAIEGLKACFFQNGMSLWASYGLFGIGLAYFNYKKERPALLSYMLEPVIGKKAVEGLPGKVINAFAIVSTVFGVSAALSICAQQLTAGFEYQFGIEPTIMVTNITIVIIAILYLMSSISGLDKGIKFLSNTNVIIATILLVYVCIAGPTVWIFRTFVEVTGLYIQDFISMATTTDAFGTIEAQTGYDFIGSNPIMYVAWFMAWTCFVGAFIARVSKGRTIREVVYGVLIIPGMVSLLWFTAFGGTGIYFDLFEGLNLTPIVVENASTSLFVLFEQLPMGEVFSILAIVVIFTFFITTADSATYIASVYSCGGTDKNPRAWVKLYWGIIIAVIAIVFLPIGGVQVSRQLSLVIAFPIVVSSILLVISLTKEFRNEKI